MEVSSTNLKGMDVSFPINGDISRAAMQPTQEEPEEEERGKSLNISSDAVNISPVGKTLAAGVVETYEDAMDLLGMTTKDIMNHRNLAIGAHTGLDAYRVAALLDGLD